MIWKLSKVLKADFVGFSFFFSSSGSILFKKDGSSFKTVCRRPMCMHLIMCEVP